MTWTALTFAFGSKLTSTKMTQLFDNFASFAAKEASAPVLADSYVVEAMIAANQIVKTKMADSSVGWNELDSAVQTNSASVAAGASVNITYTGGNGQLGPGVAGPSGNFDVRGYAASAYTSGIRLTNDDLGGGGSPSTYYYRAGYINSSPPWNMGDGDIPLFVFLEVKPDGTVIRVDIADAPPWGYNGPTDIRSGRYRADGKKFQKVRALIAEHGSIAGALLAGLTWAQIVDRLATDALVEREVTHALKNRDMPLIPNPFGGSKLDPASTIVLLDPMSPLVERLSKLHRERGMEENLTDLFLKGRIRVDNAPLARATPPGAIVTAGRLL